MADWDFYPVKFVGEQTLSLTRFPKSPFPTPSPPAAPVQAAL